MKRGEILVRVLVLAVFLSLAFIAGVYALEGADIGCAGAKRYSPYYQAQFCDSSSGNYNPYYCQCVGGSSGNGGEEPTFTPQDAKKQLINKLNDAFGTNNEEQEYIFDDLTDSQKAEVEEIFEDEIDLLHKQK